ncbi:hypothetical protein FNF31_02648 [Cafeteria roenbergensis]|uniref:Uncharacterized protein n=1 Tax=Cafeteria roenbergensis TaxID=33653 RepID=A0A5A8DGP6_CAFRO|nr:hypothetical protein FNF31_02648 [Cafeteria roenbergensis]
MDLRPGYVFGIKHDVRGAASYLDESSLVFVCGHALVRLDVDTGTKQQEIVPGTPGAASIDALASCRSKKLTAFAESYNGRRPSVTVLAWDAKPGKRKRRTIGPPALDLGSDRVASLAFSDDGKMLVVQGAEPEYTLAYISLEKSGARLLAKTRTQGATGKPILTASPHPLEPTVLLLSGMGVMKMYRYMDDSLRALSLSLKQDPKVFLAHTWLEDDRFVAATDEGELLVFEHTDFKRVLDTSPADGRPIDALAPFSKGFIAGCDGGRLLVYQRSEDVRQYYKLAGEFVVPGDPSRFLSLSVSSSEDEAALVMSSGQAYLFRLANFELHKPDDVVFAPMLAPFHGAAPSGDRSVVALTTCVRKPIFVSAGADRTIRVWSHLLSPPGAPGGDRRPEVELVKRFSEGIYSASLHPSGLHLLVGFESGLQLMNLLMEDIRPVKDVPIRRCAALGFSNGGSLFAAANGANISVFSTYTTALVAKLQGHTDNVTALAWSPDDQFLISASADFTVRRWAVRANARREHNKVVLRDVVVTSLSAAMNGHDATGALVFAVGRNMRTPTESPVLGIAFPAAEGTGSVRTSLNMSGTQHKLVSAVAGGASVVTATSLPGHKGTLRSLSAPFPAGEVTAPTIQEVVCHSGPVTAMCVTPDARLVVTGGDDGSLVLVWDAEAVKSLGDSGAAQSAAAAGAAASNSGSDGGAGAASAAAAAASSGALSGAGGASAPGSALRGARRGAGAGGAAAAAADPLGEAPPTSSSSRVGGGSSALILGATVPVGGFRGVLPGADMSVSVGLVPWAEELLVTRSALQGSRDQRSRLEASVSEVQAQNRYNETYKDMKNEEAMREIEETYREEVEAERTKLLAMREEKAAMEDRFDSQTRSMELAQQRELADLEASYKAKIQAEIERFDDLDRKRLERDAAWRDDKERLEQSHVDEEADLMEKSSADIQAEQQRAAELVAERARLEEEIRAQMSGIEAKADRELDALKLRFAEKLARQQKESTQLMFQMSVSRNTRDTLTATKTQQRTKIEALAQAEQVLQETIASLRKDLEGHKKEIQERDETLEEKDARIYDLRKKNQELEKFKFVLNYKIQELQRQIAPRQREIKDMREQTKEMELELLQYHKSNAALDLMIGELKLKRVGLKADVERIEGEFEGMGERLAEMHRAVHAAAAVADDPKAAKAAATRLYRQFVHEDDSMGQVATAEDAQAVTSEHGRRVLHLEQSMDSVRLKLAKDAQRHKADLERLNREATVLTKEVNALRRELQQLESQAAALRAGRLSDAGAPKSKRDVRGTGRTLARRGITKSASGGVSARASTASGAGGLTVPRRPPATSLDTGAALSRSFGGRAGAGAASSRADAAVEASALADAFSQLERLRAIARSDPSVSTGLRVLAPADQVELALGLQTDPKLQAALASARRALAGSDGGAAVEGKSADEGSVTLPPLGSGRRSRQ